MPKIIVIYNPPSQIRLTGNWSLQSHKNISEKKTVFDIFGSYMFVLLLSEVQSVHTSSWHIRITECSMLMCG